MPRPDCLRKDRMLPWAGVAMLALFLASMLALCNRPVRSQAPPAAAPVSVRIGYVDMQRLLTQAPQILAARTRLQAEFDARDADLRTDTAHLAELEQKLKHTTDEAALNELNRQADALRRSIERSRERLREQLATRVDEETAKAWPEINDAIAEHGREAGYDLIVTSPVAYVSGRIDVTDDVLARLRRKTERTP